MIYIVITSFQEQTFRPTYKSITPSGFFYEGDHWAMVASVNCFAAVAKKYCVTVISTKITARKNDYGLSDDCIKMKKILFS